jgi:hypothetical protein
MDVVRIDATLTAQQTAEPGGVQGGAGAEDPSRGHPTSRRESRGQMRHHVHRVGGDDQHRFRGPGGHGGHDLTKDPCVPPEQLQPRLTGFLSDARAEDDDPASDQIRVASGPKMKGMRKRHSMADVVRLGDNAGRVFVHQYDLASHALHHQGVAGRGTDEPAADDADFHLQPPGVSAGSSFRPASARRFR